MAASTFLPAVPYTKNRSHAPTGWKRKPVEAFFSQSTNDSFKGHTAESDLRDTSQPSGQKRLRKGKGKKKAVRWGRMEVKDPERDIISQSRVARSENNGSERNAGSANENRATGQWSTQNQGATTIDGGLTSMADGLGDTAAGQFHTVSETYDGQGTTVITQSAENANQGSLNAGAEVSDMDTTADVDTTDAGHAVNANGVSSEGRHVEATGLNMPDDWVPRTVKGDTPAYKIDAASLAFETVAGDIRGFKNLAGNKLNGVKKLANDDSFVRSVVDASDSKHDYTLSMLDIAVATTEDPFGKRKWNPKPVLDVMNMSVRGLVTINHEGALQKKRGMNQFRNENIRQREPDFTFDEVKHVDERLSGYTDQNIMDINGVPRDEEDSMRWNAPSGNLAIAYHNQNALGAGANNPYPDTIADRITAATYGGASNPVFVPNAMVSDNSWVSTPGWQRRERPGEQQPWNGDGVRRGFGESSIPMGDGDGSTSAYGVGFDNGQTGGYFAHGTQTVERRN